MGKLAAAVACELMGYQVAEKHVGAAHLIVVPLLLMAGTSEAPRCVVCAGPKSGSPTTFSQFCRKSPRAAFRNHSAGAAVLVCRRTELARQRWLVDASAAPLPHSYCSR